MLSKLYRLKTVAGVTVNLQQANEVTFSLCILELSGEKLQIKESFITTDFNQIKDKISDDVPLALNFTGRNVIVKRIASSEKGQQALLKLAMPNANSDDFYLQNFSSGEQTYLSIIRQAEADRWIDAFENIGLKPLQICLGAFPVNHLLSQLNIYNGVLSVCGNVIEISNDHWTNYKYDRAVTNQFPLKLNKEQIDESILLCYAAAFQLILSNEIDLVIAEGPGLSKAYDNYTFLRKFKINAAIVLCCLFVLLLLNFLLFSYYTSENEKLAARVGQTAHDITKANDLTDSLTKEKAALDSLGWEGKINKSILIDQIAQLLPSEVTWERAEIDPVLKTGQSQNITRFSNRTIKVTGNSNKIIPVNEWIERVKSKTWVKKVTLQDYSFNNDTNTGQFVVYINY